MIPLLEHLSCIIIFVHRDVVFAARVDAALEVQAAHDCSAAERGRRAQQAPCGGRKRRKVLSW